MRISWAGCANGSGRCIQAPGGKFEHCLNLLPRDMKLFDDFFYAQARLKILKNCCYWHSRAAKYPCTAPSVRHTFDGGAL